MTRLPQQLDVEGDQHASLVGRRPSIQTAREVLISELLGEIDQLLARVALLQSQSGEAHLQAVAALEGATRDLTTRIADFSSRAKVELAQYVQAQTQGIVGRTVEEQRAAFQSLCREIVAKELSALAARQSVRPDTPLFDAGHALRLVEAAIAGMAGGAVFAMLMFLLR
jgi:phage shock protein A